MFAFDRVERDSPAAKKSSLDKDSWGLTTLYPDDKYELSQMRSDRREKGKGVSGVGKGDAQRYAKFRDPGKARRFVEYMDSREEARVSSGLGQRRHNDSDRRSAAFFDRNIHGPYASEETIRIFNNPEEAIRFNPSQDRRHAGMYSGVRRSPARKKAIRRILGPVPFSNDPLWKRVVDAVPVIDRSWLVEFRKRAIDNFEALRQDEMELTAKDRLERKELFRDLSHNSSHAAAMIYSRAGLVFSGVMERGQVVHKEGVTSVEDFELKNSGTMRVLNEDTGVIDDTPHHIPNLYPDGATGGLLSIIEPIATPSNNLLIDFFTYRRALRGYRLDNVTGKEVPIAPEDMQEAMNIVKDHPEIAIVNDNYNRWNDMLVDFLRDTQVIDEDMASVWKEYGDYVPFFLGLSGETTGAIEEIMREKLNRVEDFQIINEIVGAKPSKRYIGRKAREVYNVVDDGGNVIRSFPARSDAVSYIRSSADPASYKVDSDVVADLMDPMEALSKNVMAAISNGLANVAALRAIDNSSELGNATRMDESGPMTVTVRREGQNQHWLVTDLQMHMTLIGAFDGRHPVFEALSWPVNVLRSFITRQPGYWFRNMNRDSFMSWVFSGVRFAPIANAVKNLNDEMMVWIRTGEHSPTYKNLERGLAIGGYEQTRSRETPKKLKRAARKGIGKGSRNILMMPFEKLWYLLGETGSVSESLTRRTVYEDTYRRMIDEGYSEREAFGEANRQAIEVINFNKSGSSPILQFFISTVPFVNSKVQGMDVAARALSGTYNPRGVSESQVRSSVRMRGALMGLMTLAYVAYYKSDEEREEELGEAVGYTGPARWDNWWFKIPWTDYYFPLPAPFEAGFLFKLIPEQIAEYISGQSSRDTVDALMHGIWGMLGLNPIPQAIKPVVEVQSNWDQFRKRHIVPYFKEKLGGYASSPTSNVLYKELGESIGVSPYEIDHLIRGYTGSILSTVFMGADKALSMTPMYPDRPEWNIEDYPVVSEFVKHKHGGGGKRAFYEWASEVDKAVAVQKALREDGRDEDADKHYDENKSILQFEKVVNSVKKHLRSIRKEIDVVNKSTTMEAEEKKKRLYELGASEAKYLGNVKDAEGVITGRGIRDYIDESDLPVRVFPWQ